MSKKFYLLIFSFGLICLLIVLGVLFFGENPASQEELAPDQFAPTAPLSSFSQKPSSYEVFEEAADESSFEEIGPDEITEPPEAFIPIEVLKKRFQPADTVLEEPWQEAESATPRLSEEEYFSSVYPKEYIEYFNTLQDLMLKDGFLEKNHKITVKTEEDTYAVLSRFVDYMAEKEYLSEEERENLKHGFNVVLPKLNREERPLVEKRLLGARWYEFVDAILAFLVSQASAQAMCFTPGAGGPIGFNGGAPCCNCGYNFHHGVPHFVPYCAGFMCDINLGCLNGVCMGRPAIWDPMTGICGCG